MKMVFLQRQVFALPGISLMAENVLRRGHRADVLIENAEKRFEAALTESRPDVVGARACKVFRHRPASTELPLPDRVGRGARDSTKIVNFSESCVVSG